ncbi:uncharacterized protein DFL_008680 [Arthrobotrys flagrans]|uniref:C2H2-type domain-containing protein n=1 Tax=Arthrobotrys flagrans TaxID=97331 RepID=A0A436ZPG5_ARTFL|nr:hypothetical protein DFL_008680 [Arthrobotrys flagrans]
MLDVNYTFATYSEAEILLPSDNRKSLGCFLNYEDIQKTNPFRCCRASCGLPFSVLSGLIQHMDSHRYKVSCGQQSIVDHLRINVYYQSVLHKIQKMTSTNPATIFVTLPPHQVHKTFLRLPEHWHLMSSELTLYLLSALGNISCGKPNDQGRNFLAFKNPHDMRKVLDSIGDLVTRLRDELQEIAAAQAAKGDNGPDQILVYFGTTEEAHSLARFLNDVDKFKKALSNELPG